MLLTEPLPQSYVGGETKLVFTGSITELDVSINGSSAPINHSVPTSNTYTVSVNNLPTDTPLKITINYKESGIEHSESITVYKPRHDLGGMGATVIRQNNSIIGTFFKFWLPKVEDVYVIGSFNNWAKNTRTFRLDQLGNSGYWYGFSPDARPGDDYKFFVRGFDGNESEVSDPAARDTIKTSHNEPDDNDANAVIVDPTNFEWLYDSYYADRRRDLRQYIIYQAHWGTFFRQSSGSLDYEKFTEGTSLSDKRFSVAQKLKHIAELGFTALELLPIHESNGATNAGYDPSFYFAVESAYGNPNDLRILVDEAHKLGLSVIFDAVINHLTADLSHSSFSQKFIQGWYIKENAPWSNHNLFGGSDWGPDPDFDRPEIRSLLTNCIRMYFNEYHVDGIRFDATTTIPKPALKEIIGQLQLEYGWQGKYLIAEHLTDDPFDYIVGDIGCNAGWYKPAFNEGIYRVVGSLGQGSLESLRQVFETNHDGQPQSAIKYLLGSHDENWESHGGKSAIHRFGGPFNNYSRMKMRLAWALNVCALGTPMMFMGTEYMTDRPWHDYFGYNGTNAIARPVPFVWEPSANSAEGKFMKMVRDINRLRTKVGALRTSNKQCKLVHVDNKNGVYTYKRWDYFGNVVLIVINISEGQWENREYQLYTDSPNSSWHEIFNSQYVNYGGWTGSGNSDPSFNPAADGKGLLQGINIPKWSLMILKQK